MWKETVRILILVLGIALLLTWATPAVAQNPATQPGAQPSALDQVVDRIVAREQALVKELREYSPLIEVYIQDQRPDIELSKAPARDHYFLGKAALAEGVVYRTMTKKRSGVGRVLSALNPFSRRIEYFPDGFLEMIYLDPRGFDRRNYNFRYVRREFLGEVRCLVFDISPVNAKTRGAFLGRIWVEDEGFNVVRFNGTLTHSTPRNLYFHFDSWRVNLTADKWFPAYVYSEESEGQPTFWSGAKANFKAQVRLWGYQLSRGQRTEEFSQLLIESEKPVQDQSETSPDRSPVESQRLWDRQGEENVIERLQAVGLLAPDGEVNKVLETVLNNLQVTNDVFIDPPVRARVLVTSTLEAFTLGHTIVLSRGLIDVLPDEASLAAILAQQLGHILSGHQLDGRYAFHDRFIFPDDETLRRLNFGRTPQEITQAGAKGLELMRKSPYKDDLGKAGLFLATLQSRSKELTSLIQPNLGNGVVPQADLLAAAPALEMGKKEQVTALPLGSRVKLDPWTAQVALMHGKPVALISAREKMPFEVSPFMLYLTRFRAEQPAAPGDGSPAAQARKQEPPQ
jgi:hypothetical protein